MVVTAVQSKHMTHQQLSSLKGRGEFSQRKKKCTLGEIVNGSEDDCVTEGGRPVIKFTAMCDQGQLGTGRGCSKPAGG